MVTAPSGMRMVTCPRVWARCAHSLRISQPVRADWPRQQRLNSFLASRSATSRRRSGYNVFAPGSTVSSRRMSGTARGSMNMPQRRLEQRQRQPRASVSPSRAQRRFSRSRASGAQRSDRPSRGEPRRRRQARRATRLAAGTAARRRRALGKEARGDAAAQIHPGLGDPRGNPTYGRRTSAAGATGRVGASAGDGGRGVAAAHELEEQDRLQVRHALPSGRFVDYRGGGRQSQRSLGTFNTPVEAAVAHARQVEVATVLDDVVRQVAGEPGKKESPSQGVLQLDQGLVQQSFDERAEERAARKRKVVEESAAAGDARAVGAEADAREPGAARRDGAGTGACKRPEQLDRRPPAQHRWRRRARRLVVDCAARFAHGAATRAEGRRGRVRSIADISSGPTHVAPASSIWKSRTFANARDDPRRPGGWRRRGSSCRPGRTSRSTSGGVCTIRRWHRRRRPGRASAHTRLVQQSRASCRVGCRRHWFGRGGGGSARAQRGGAAAGEGEEAAVDGVCRRSSAEAPLRCVCGEADPYMITAPEERRTTTRRTTSRSSSAAIGWKRRKRPRRRRRSGLRRRRLRRRRRRLQRRRRRSSNGCSAAAAKSGGGSTSSAPTTSPTSGRAG